MSSKKWLSVTGYSSLLPDDRPITAISVVEDIDKCPPNFTAVRYNLKIVGIFVYFLFFFLFFITFYENLQSDST